ncbi:MAG TPA: YccF domain-containing protein [Bacteroidales bacterium]|nr:YccF domain-containing protein [Bacteroidales bacterium]HUX56044.1 YccF domain-containing protein [Bacteroidales bacterium]
MNLLGNLIWLIFGGIIIAIEYLIGSIFLMITIVGIPFGIQTLKMASLALWPFGRDTRVHSRASGCLYILMNVIWLLTGGLWIAATHAIFGIILCITIIGIPFGLQHFKLSAIALNPFGRDIVNV